MFWSLSIKLLLGLSSNLMQFKCWAVPWYRSRMILGYANAPSVITRSVRGHASSSFFSGLAGPSLEEVPDGETGVRAYRVPEVVERVFHFEKEFVDVEFLGEPLNKSTKEAIEEIGVLVQPSENRFLGDLVFVREFPRR